jgi:hypothetical protein
MNMAITSSSSNPTSGAIVWIRASGTGPNVSSHSLASGFPTSFVNAGQIFCGRSGQVSEKVT